MAVKDEIEFRPANMEEDLEFAYLCLFKPGIEKCVKELNGGVWPESRYEFFKKGFSDPDMMMISHNGIDVGCFCISKTDAAVVLERVYLLHEYQRQGIGNKLIGMALKAARELNKPLELEVLANNTQAINSYKKAGFEQSSEIIVKGWNQKVTMRHKDTKQYMHAAVFTAKPLQNRQPQQQLKVA